MCVTVVLAETSNTSCQSVHKHVTDRCHKSKYAFEANTQSQSQEDVTLICDAAFHFTVNCVVRLNSRVM